jgi:serine/threonine-protein kinase
MTPPLTPPVSPGDILAGKYRVERVLGVGGMGVVVAAEHLHLRERVAIKLLHAHALATPILCARFEREARAAVKIKSEHVAHVIDVGRLEDGAPYIVMEYLEGHDLSTWIRSHGVLSVELAVEFILQASEAIAEAHALGIVHRDLKPANLFVVRRADGLWSVKVLDFGISKVTVATDSVADVNMTRTEAMLGSPLYMSPEQLESPKMVDARTDLWALGVILHELLAGDPPFRAAGFAELILRISRDPPHPIESRRPDVPAGLAAVIARCLEKDRAKRYATVAELAEALKPFAPERAKPSVDRVSRVIKAAGPISVPTLHVEPNPSATYHTWGRSGAAASAARRARPIGATAMIALGAMLSVGVVLGGVVLLLVHARTASSAAPPKVAPAAVAPASAPPAAPEPAPPVASVTLAAPDPGPVPSVAPPAPPPIPRPASPPLAAVHTVVAVTPTAPPSSRPPKPPAAVAPAPAADTCDPPYYVDSAGHRQYRPQCL